MMIYATLTTWYEDAVEAYPLLIGMATGVVIWWLFL